MLEFLPRASPMGFGSMATYLIGGFLLFLSISTVLDPAGILAALVNSTALVAAFSSFSGILVAASAIPLGYVINQVWMAFYNVFLDVHAAIPFPGQSTDSSLSPTTDAVDVLSLPEMTRATRWRRAYINELHLALLHRRSAALDSEPFLSWHRNRLNELHSNGVVVSGLLLGLVTAFLLSAFLPEVTWFIHPVSSFMIRRWYLIVLVLVLSAVSVLRMSRSYRLIVLYNQLSVRNACNKCALVCSAVSLDVPGESRESPRGTDRGN